MPPAIARPVNVRRPKTRHESSRSQESPHPTPLILETFAGSHERLSWSNPLRQNNMIDRPVPSSLQVPNHLSNELQPSITATTRTKPITAPSRTHSDHPRRRFVDLVPHSTHRVLHRLLLASMRDQPPNVSLPEQTRLAVNHFLPRRRPSDVTFRRPCITIRRVVTPTHFRGHSSHPYQPQLSEQRRQLSYLRCRFSHVAPMLRIRRDLRQDHVRPPFRPRHARHNILHTLSNNPPPGNITLKTTWRPRVHTLQPPVQNPKIPLPSIVRTHNKTIQHRPPRRKPIPKTFSTTTCCVAAPHHVHYMGRRTSNNSQRPSGAPPWPSSNQA